MHVNFFQTSFVLLLWTFCYGQSVRENCQVCRALIKEAEWVISLVDPKKSIQVGSFRVDPKGNQKIKDKQYARSEVHLEEVIEEVCDKLGHYAQATFDDGAVLMVKTIGFNGKQLQTKDLKLDRDKGKTFKYKCENFLEDYEEKIIKLLQHETIDNYEQLICGEHLEVCSSDELSVQKMTLYEAEDEDNTDEAEANENEDSPADDNENVKSSDSSIDNEDEKEEL